MKSFRKLFTAVAAVAALTGASQSQAVLMNWYLDSDGAAGAGAAVRVSQYVDLNGKAYVHNTFTSSTSFTFNEVATFVSTLADGSRPLSPMITSSFVGTGSGTTGGQLSFSSGLLQLSSGANLIGTFNLTSGSANLAGGTVLPNGPVSLVFKAASLASGYFFKDASLTTDLSTLVAAPGGLLFGFATTNAIPLDRDEDFAPLVAQYNAKFDPDSSASGPNGTTDLYLSNNGQFKLEIPEPGSLALVGLALAGLGVASRRRK